MDLDVTQIAELVRRLDTDLTSKRARKLHRSNATREYMIELGHGKDTDSDSEQSMDKESRARSKTRIRPSECEGEKNAAERSLK